MGIDHTKVDVLCRDYESKTIAWLDAIIRNRPSYSHEEFQAAVLMLPRKLAEKRTYNQGQTDAIHELVIRSEKWFDFHVFSFDGSNLIVAGDYDLTYGHSLEIIFENVGFMQLHSHWSADFEKRVIELPDPVLEKS